MRRKVGGIDRAVRVVVGTFLIGLGLGRIRGKGRLIVAAVDLVPLVTGITRSCALYVPLNIDTGKREPDLEA